MAATLACLAVLGMSIIFLAISSCSSRDGLTSRQRALWEASKSKIMALYAAEGRVPAPMSKADVDAIRVPLNCGESKMGPLPWDVKLLLQFDKNLFIDRHPDLTPFFCFIVRPDWAMFAPQGVNEFILEESFLVEGGTPEMTQMANKAFLEEGAALPAVLALSQIGGDELPNLWMVTKADEPSVVIHFDYDDEPEFYIRSLCLLEYVAHNIVDAGTMLPRIPGSDGTDASQALTSEEQAAMLERLRPQLEELNRVMWHGLDAAFESMD